MYIFRLYISGRCSLSDIYKVSIILNIFGWRLIDEEVNKIVVSPYFGSHRIAVMFKPLLSFFGNTCIEIQ